MILFFSFFLLIKHIFYRKDNQQQYFCFKSREMMDLKISLI